jgi:Flp pilus assembly protein TadD
MRLWIIALIAAGGAAPALAGTAGTPALSAGSETQRMSNVPVAYEAMKAGQNDVAIREILADQSVRADDPSRLINLGTAYARIGRVNEAAAMYRAAIRSDERYAVELSDGQWVDSQDAAKRALARLTAATDTRMAAK